MARVLKKSDQTTEVKEVQTLLMDKGYLTDEDINGIFDHETLRAVRLFQAQNLDQNGHPLVVDGKVGELTWRSLHHPKPITQNQSAIDFVQMRPASKCGSASGRAGLADAIDELKVGAGEVGGNNRRPFVKKYLNGIVDEANPWCAGFVSFCFSQIPCGMPSTYAVGARDVLRHVKNKGWAQPPNSGHEPKPGDVAVWWREWLPSGNGHVGLVHQRSDGVLYPIEGNKSPNVPGFWYVFSRMDKLLGFGHVSNCRLRRLA